MNDTERGPARISFKASENLSQRLKDHSHNEGWSQSKLIRLALMEFLDTFDRIGRTR